VCNGGRHLAQRRQLAGLYQLILRGAQSRLSARALVHLLA
jgi:hypothetical protein